MELKEEGGKEHSPFFQILERKTVATTAKMLNCHNMELSLTESFLTPSTICFSGLRDVKSNQVANLVEHENSKTKGEKEQMKEEVIKDGRIGMLLQK